VNPPEITSPGTADTPENTTEVLTVTAVDKNIKPPQQAKAAGYKKLVFADDFDDPETIDLANTQTGDFNWYLAQWFHHGQTTLDPADLIIENSVLTIAADSWNLVSAFDTHPQVPDQFHGNVFGDGGYFEVRLRYDHAAAGVTSFYAMSIEHIADASVHNNNANVGLGHWPGQPDHFGHWIEIDIFETLYDWNHGYQAHVHDWSGILYDQIVDIRNNDNYYTPVDLSDPEAFHTYGALWVPQKNNTPGRIEFYCDEILKSTLYYSGPVGEPPLPGQTDGNWTPDTSDKADRTYSILDSHRLALCLQPSANTPLHVDWIRVWK
jgi:hypothetical protein